jgi:holo-[acyl-carrier protein] synthase
MERSGTEGPGRYAPDATSLVALSLHGMWEDSVNRSQSGLRVGLDLTSVAEVEDSVARFGDRYVRRIFTNHEIESCSREGGVASEGLAARFAAKEATIKVLRPSQAQPDYRSIQVRRHPDGWCEIELAGTAAELAEAEGVRHLALSLTHEAGMAAAVVVAVCDN